ncbi:MAG TPA: Ig-like domain-containing protein [Verrucomicrobiae bacterium]|nr:Ig-like domain-containing protein [Verrucomicrobiae bacterium]
MRSSAFGILSLACAVLLSACNNGVSFEDGVAPTTPTPTGTGIPTVVDLTVSQPQLPSEGNTTGEGVTITAFVRDADNGVVSGARVNFSVDNGGIVNPQVATTNADGFATTVVTTGNDPTNRFLVVNAVARSGSGSGNATDTVQVEVINTTISITGPDNAQFGAPATYTVTLLDSAQQGIGGRTVTISSSAGNTLSATTLTTNASGLATFTYTPTNSGATADTLTATALGISDTHPVGINTDSFTFTAPSANAQINLATSQPVTVRWRVGGVDVADGTLVNFATTRGTLTPATATTVGGFATVDISSSSAGVATIVATSSAGTQPQSSLQVEFVATTPAKIAVQASPDVIGTNSTSEITATVRDAADNLVKGVQVSFSLTDNTGGTIDTPLVTTNTAGVAKVIYTSSGTTSATDGVQISATVNGITANTTLTVGGRAARIVLGTGNEIFEANQTTYRFPYSVIVTRSDGSAAAGTQVFLKAESLRFRKGLYVTVNNKKVPLITATCANEDGNSNAVLDANEDDNGNGQLDPSNVATVPNSVTVGSNGAFQFDVTYPQDRGTWVVVRLTASATVTGSEATTSVDFILPISAGDADNPPGPVSPYGIEGDRTGDGTPEDDDMDSKLACNDSD